MIIHHIKKKNGSKSKEGKSGKFNSRQFWGWTVYSCLSLLGTLTGPGFKRNPDKECPVSGKSSFPPIGGLSTTERRLKTEN